MAWDERAPGGAREFCIETSDERAGGDGVAISADLATCDACLTELFDSADRRYRYPFINCTNCGPRLTIIDATPYDRARTTMAGFPPCDACRREYADPASRRFHAQPNACAACGPRLLAREGSGALDGDALVHAARVLREGGIVAVKGLGGYHLACDGTSDDAVRELRRRKHRDDKPLALMVRELDGAARLCHIDADEETLLSSPARPIVLLRRRAGAKVAHEVAPHSPWLGLMLAYTPLHHLLLAELDGTPLVMTSGNRTDEPIAIDDDDALARLAGIADLFLAHDRPIRTRCDDSVARVIGGRPTVLRRSRGESPRPLVLPFPCRRPLLALGGELKATFALGRGATAILGPHHGDLEDHHAYRAYVDAIAHFERLFAIRPAVLAHDLHPDYASTRYAGERARAEGLEVVAVQHHHAHVAACMAEHGLDEPVIGVALDGGGYGLDRTIWGGEFLVGDYRNFRRAAHLRPVPMPGGERAIREPWRMAVAHLRDAGIDAGNRPEATLRVLCAMIDRRVGSPLTSSMGRLFDAVAAIVGVRDEARHEAQAAMELEWMATDLSEDGAYPCVLAGVDDTLVVDTRPIVGAVHEDHCGGVAAPRIARRFHSTVVDIIDTVCRALRDATGLETVVLTGGVFMNAIVAAEARRRLSDRGFRVRSPAATPTNDGGLSLGQLAIAAAREV
ncbi:carbamoyltransferase HypF [Nannocystis exedens]|uniref:carbamoyltransferase HypF n=1 Tax=Nannocystis exedens TaxID=54 RepID=UPI000B20A037|nr:HAD family hydrolase [Nannocystis exedens]